MALAIPEYQLGNVDSYLRQRRAAGRPVTQRDYEAAYGQYWDTQLGRQLEAKRIGIMERQVGLGEKQLDLRKQEIKDENDAAQMRGYFEGLGTLFQGLFVAGYGREKGWW